MLPLILSKENIALRNFAVSIGLVVLATGLTWFAWPYNQASPYAFYYLAAVLAALYGGWLSSALAIFIGALLGDYLFIPPFYSWQMLYDIEGVAHVLVFTTISASIVGLVESLRRTQERLRRVLEETYTAIWDWDIPSGKVFWTPQHFTMLGYEPNCIEPSFANWAARVHPDDWARTEAAVRNAMEQHRDYCHQFRTLWPDGTIRWIEAHGTYTYRSDGQCIRMLGLMRDITESKQTEQAQRDSEQRLRAIYDGTHEYIGLLAPDGTMLDCNRASLEFAGITHDQIIGRPFWETPWWVQQPASELEQLKQAIARAAAGEFVRYEVTLNKPAGGFMTFDFSLHPVRDENGQVVLIVPEGRDITERKSAEEKIKQLAFYDPLTQLANRRLLQDRLKHGIDMARRQRKQLALLMLDLDFFKRVNDSFGHQAGDELLRQVALRIKEKLSDVDLVARLGGDEFTVILEDIAHVDDAARVAEEIILTLSKPFQLVQGKDVRISVSIGISLYPQHGDNTELLLDHADAALYLAKSQGRGGCAYFSEEITRSVRARIALEAKLRDAIMHRELIVFYQPQIDILSGRVIGAEALVRWQDPGKELVLPNNFIPIAEETHLIVELGEWVLWETCKQGRQWLDRGFPAFNLAVNISPYQFRQSDINALVAKVLAETGFPARQLELEITESGLMENQDKVMDILNNLRAQGVRLAIDDFGTGYSSLAYLKRFPLDVLKIDKGFIDEIPDNKDDMEIAATIVAMGHTLGLKVTAEGVETPEQLAFLQTIGCDAYQGFIKSQPMPAEKFIDWLISI